MDKKRLDYLDMVKGIGIFFVVLGHMQDISTTTRIWISSFHMPLFFIVSGLLMAVKDEPSKDIREVIRKKFKGLIIPYLWFSLSYFVIDIMNVLVVKNIDGITFIVDTISSVTFYGMSVLWFLPALFIASISFIYMKKKLPDKFCLVLLIAIAILSYVAKLQIAKVYDLYADSLLITSLINIVYIFLRAWVSMSFIGYAYYIRKIYERTVIDGKRFSIINNRIVEFVLGIVMIGIGFVIGMKNECVDLHNIILNNVVYYYLAALLGVYGIILVCKALPVINLVTYYGQNSIIVMACHVNYYILYAGIKFSWLIQPYVNHAKHYVFVITTVITVFVLSTIVIEVIRRMFPFVIGKSYKNHG